MKIKELLVEASEYPKMTRLMSINEAIVYAKKNCSIWLENKEKIWRGQDSENGSFQIASTKDLVRSSRNHSGWSNLLVDFFCFV